MKFLSVNYWIENYLLGALKSFLDKSGSGWKTLLGLFVLVLRLAASSCSGSYCSALQHVLDLVEQLPFDPIKDAGIVLLVSGLVHKMLNFQSK